VLVCSAALDGIYARHNHFVEQHVDALSLFLPQLRVQGILRRKSLDQDALQGGWVVDSIRDTAPAAQQCSAQAETAIRPSRVTFCLPGSPETAV
jgi:hypothetical protein